MIFNLFFNTLDMNFTSFIIKLYSRKMKPLLQQGIFSRNGSALQRNNGEIMIPCKSSHYAKLISVPVKCFPYYELTQTICLVFHCNWEFQRPMKHLNGIYMYLLVALLSVSKGLLLITNTDCDILDLPRCLLKRMVLVTLKYILQTQFKFVCCV